MLLWCYSVIYTDLVEASCIKDCTSVTLQDLVYSALPSKRAKSQLGPIMSFLLSIWHCIEKKCIPNSTKWHTQSPIFHNFNLLTGGIPFSFSKWREKGISVLSDICDDKGIKLFNDLCTTYNLPGTSFFFYLRLRQAMRTYFGPWDKFSSCSPSSGPVGCKGPNKRLGIQIILNVS